MQSETKCNLSRSMLPAQFNPIVGINSALALHLTQSTLISAQPGYI